MDNRTAVKLLAMENTVALRTFSRKFSSPQGFLVLYEELERLQERGYILASDIYSFADLRLRKAAAGRDVLEITFAWLQCSGDNTLYGRRERVVLDYAAFQKAVAESREAGGVYKNLLSVRETGKPRIEFHSRKNLDEVLKRKVLRRRLGKFLDQHFNWAGAEKILISDDFVPYSFFFQEIKSSGHGICGGIILHGQENMQKAYYGMHT